MPTVAPEKKYYSRKPPPSISRSSQSRYCHQCKKTTKRNEDGKCLNPGHRSSTMSLEDRIDEVFGLISEADDNPVKFKHDGTKKKSAEGTHRPDKGVEFNQLKYDDQFKTLANYYKLR